MIDKLNAARKRLDHFEKVKAVADKLNEADKAKEEQTKNWQRNQIKQINRENAAMETGDRLEKIADQSDEELNTLLEETIKAEEEAKTKLKELQARRLEAVKKGDKALADSFLEQIFDLEDAARNNDRLSDAARRELDKRGTAAQHIAEKQSAFEQTRARQNDRELFNSAISKNAPVKDLRQLMDDLKHVRNIQLGKADTANAAGDFTARDQAMKNAEDAAGKIAALENRLNQRDMESGFYNKLSQMAQVGMYLSKSDQGLNDPKLMAARESNELLRQIKDNTAQQAGGLE